MEVFELVAISMPKFSEPSGLERWVISVIFRWATGGGFFPEEGSLCLEIGRGVGERLARAVEGPDGHS